MRAIGNNAYRLNLFKLLSTAIVLLLLVSACVLIGNTSTANNGTASAGNGHESAGIGGDTTILADTILPGPTLPPGTKEIQVSSVPTENLNSATLKLQKPDSSDLIPYYDRGFNLSVTAAIAWWMNPAYLNDTNYYRRYLRSTPQVQATYPIQEQIFFNFETVSLDYSISRSTLNEDLVLFRGITSDFSAIIINNARFEDQAFASTSYDITESVGEFSNRSSDGYASVLVINYPDGGHTLYIDETQREYLLPRGTTWDVIKVVNVDKLNIQANFPLHSDGKRTDKIDKVRFIYIKQQIAG